MNSHEKMKDRKVSCTSFLKVVGALLTVCAFVFSQSAFAQASVEKKELTDSSSTKQTLTDAQGKKIQVVDFEDATIEGKAKAPEGFVLQSRTGSNFRNIIELRRDFRNRIQTSTPTIRSVSPSSP
jgi:hypothetical protein